MERSSLKPLSRPDSDEPVIRFFNIDLATENIILLLPYSVHNAKIGSFMFHITLNHMVIFFMIVLLVGLASKVGGDETNCSFS